MALKKRQRNSYFRNPLFCNNSLGDLNEENSSLVRLISEDKNYNRSQFIIKHKLTFFHSLIRSLLWGKSGEELFLSTAPRNVIGQRKHARQYGACAAARPRLRARSASARPHGRPRVYYVLFHAHARIILQLRAKVDDAHWIFIVLLS